MNFRIKRGFEKCREDANLHLLTSNPVELWTLPNTHNETVWTLVLDNGKWKVDNIEQSEMTIQYAKMENIVPVLGGVKVT